MVTKMKAVIETKTSLTVKVFASNAAMNDYMYEGQYGQVEAGYPAICAGISFDTAANGVYKYRLRYNLSLRTTYGGDKSNFPETQDENRLWLHKRYAPPPHF